MKHNAPNIIFSLKAITSENFCFNFHQVIFPLFSISSQILKVIAIIHVHSEISRLQIFKSISAKSNNSKKKKAIKITVGFFLVFFLFFFFFRFSQGN